MSRQLYMAPVAPQPIEAAAQGRRYRALLCSVGFETRSRAIAERLYPSVGELYGVEFPDRHNEVYKQNRAVMDELQARVCRLDDEPFSAWIADWLTSLAREGRQSVAVDVSSMSRPRIAGVVQAIIGLPTYAKLTVDLLYTAAQYEKAPTEMPDATEALDPVTPAFAGVPADPQQPLVLIFGLGYEPERAASALDEFAPQRAIPFFPVGGDERFEADVQAANASVLELSDVAEPWCYAIKDPFRTFCDLEVLLDRIRSGHQGPCNAGEDPRAGRPLLLPLGPKIFAATCMLAAASADRPVAVWRVSSGALEEANDRRSDGELVTLRVSTAPLPNDTQPDLGVSTQPVRSE
jgi:hypothetical protein